MRTEEAIDRFLTLLMAVSAAALPLSFLCDPPHGAFQ
jgi:hypothetical protein